MISMTIDGTITSWNPGAEELYGYTPDEAIGQRIHMLIPNHRPDEGDEILTLIQSGQKVRFSETERVRKDGSIVEVSVTNAPIKDAVGAVVGASSVVRDITERKRADRALRELQEGFRSAFEHAPIG